MLNLGLIQNLPAKSDEMTNKSSRGDFSLDSTRSKNKADLNSSSTSKNKTLEKKSDFLESLNKKIKNDEVQPSDVDSKKQIVRDEKSQIQTKEDKISESDVESSKPEQNSDYSEIVPLYAANPFFAPQAAIPERDPTEENVIEKKLVAALGSPNVSEESIPVIKFMKDLYQKLGISPHKLIQAFESLPTEALVQSPQSSMDALFTKLELQPGEYTKAQILYNEMITDLEKQNQLKGYKEVQVKPNIAESFKLQKQELSKISKAQQSLENSPLLEQPNIAPQQPSLAPKTVKSTLEQMLQDRILNSQGPIAPRADFVSPMNMQLEAPIAEEPIYDTNFLKQLAEYTNSEGIVAKDSATAGTESAQEGLKEAIGQLLDKAASAENSGNSKDNKDKNEDPLANMFQIHDKGLDPKMLNKEFVIDVNPQAKKLSFENVDKIISQAQTVVEKGGGEMKIQMMPEGLGTVHLKIKVQDGQVGIQMITDSMDAKKLLEGSLQDLKISLADHKLNLDTIKVDVSDKLSQDMLQQDFKREEAREFLNQFRQYNESFRQAAADSSGLVRNYRKESKPQPVNVEPTQTAKKKSDSGRLHLVA